MATTDAKPGFRLPWSADRGHESAAVDTPTTAEGVVDATLESEVEPPAMIDTPTFEAGDRSASAAQAGPPGPPATPATPATPARKPNKLMADLTRAMQAAAEQARTDALERLGADAKTFIESIHAASSTQATELRRRADDDVAAIREWSKAEIARIREETERRIGDRKAALEQEIDAHAAAIEGRIERVQARVAAFEAEMAAFFEHLTGEDDPTRLAAMAEQLPEPPTFDLEADAESGAEAWAAAEPPPPAPGAWTGPEAAVTIATEPAADAHPFTEAEASVDAEAGAGPTGDDHTDAWPSADVAIDFAAAEAEAAAFDGADLETVEAPVLADDALAARLAALTPIHGSDGETSTTRVVVLGLVSVASIAGFKRLLTRAAGVTSVGVSSGPDGEFVFAVTHATDLDLAATITSLPGFGARVTGAAEGTLSVTARDPETEA
ncbi:MAG: hypothetical protein ACLGIJ_08870 [Candidatus Limnocylindria bacterium]